MRVHPAAQVTQLILLAIKEFLEGLLVLTMLLAWIVGIVLATGPWIALAISFPPYAWIVVAENILKAHCGP